MAAGSMFRTGAAPQRLVLLVIHVVAAAVGAKLGFGFGLQIGGMPMGVLLAANSALFGWLMVGALDELVQRLRQR